MSTLHCLNLLAVQQPVVYLKLCGVYNELLMKKAYFTPGFSQFMGSGAHISHLLCLKGIEINVTLFKLTR